MEQSSKGSCRKGETCKSIWERKKKTFSLKQEGRRNGGSSGKPGGRSKRNRKIYTVGYCSNADAKEYRKNTEKKERIGLQEFLRESVLIEKD